MFQIFLLIVKFFIYVFIFKRSFRVLDTKFWDFLILYRIFFSPQVKLSVIISNKRGMYEFCTKLPNELRLKILGN